MKSCLLQTHPIDVARTARRRLTLRSAAIPARMAQITATYADRTVRALVAARSQPSAAASLSLNPRRRRRRRAAPRRRIHAHNLRLLILDQPVVIAAIRVPNDIVQHNESLELQLKTGHQRRRQRILFEASQPKVRILEAVDKHLERADFRRQTHPIEFRARIVVLDGFLDFRLLPIESRIVERFGDESDDARFGDDIESQLLVDKAGARLGQIALVGDETGATETTRTAQFVHPFHPLGIEATVGFFVFRLEHGDGFLREVETKNYNWEANEMTLTNDSAT